MWDEKMWRWEDVRRCEKMWVEVWEDVSGGVRRCEKMWEDVRRSEHRCEKMWEDVYRSCEDVTMWPSEDVKMRRWGDAKVWRWEDEKKIWGWEDGTAPAPAFKREIEKKERARGQEEKMWDEKMWRWEDVKMRRCEDEKMFYRPPLLEEPCAQTLWGKRMNIASGKLTVWPWKPPIFSGFTNLPTPRLRQSLCDFTGGYLWYGTWG